MRKLAVALYCLLAGLPLTISALSTGGFWWWLWGIVLAASFAPVALFGPRRSLSQFGVVVPVLLIVTVLFTWSEALTFVPEILQHLFRNLAGGFVIYVIVAMVLAALAAILKLPRGGGASLVRRWTRKQLPMVGDCGVAYLLNYYVFGGITFHLYTPAMA
jgi:amino acid transporter